MTDTALGEGLIPGVIADFRRNDVNTALYMPYKPDVPLDLLWHQNSGIDEHFYASFHENISERTNDGAALDKMKADIEQWIDNDEQYATFFFPQIGHGPWNDRPESTTIVENGQSLTITQDAWLGEVVEILKRKNKLDTTTIIVTGDHGVRTVGEDPDFSPGTISDYTFHVPLFIYSKQFQGKNIIDAFTSHVDLAPTISELYGISYPDLRYQGIPIWEAGNVERELYFPAGWYYNADGFYGNQNFYMWSRALGLFYESEDLDFNNDEVISDQDKKQMVINKLSAFNKLQMDRLTSICESNFSQIGAR